MNQTFENWQLIIIDNFSTDETESVIKSFKSPKISHIKFANQGVIGASRNIGIKHSLGEFVAFLDSDDLWMPEKLSAYYNLCCAGANFICSKVEVFGDGIPSYTSRDLCQEASQKPFLHLLRLGNFISTSTVAANLKLIGHGFSENSSFVTAEDFDLWLEILSKANCDFRFVQSPLTRYRIHSGNNSSKTIAHINAVMNVRRKWSSHHAVSSNDEAKLWQAASRQSMLKNDRGSAFKYALKSIALSPFAMKSYVLILILPLPSYIRNLVISLVSK